MKEAGGTGRRRALFTRLRRAARWTYLRLIRSRASPHQVALAFATGLFIGIMPGIGWIFAAALCAVLRLNLAACMVGVALTNPVAFPFFYVGGPLVGAWIFDLHLPDALAHPSSLSAFWSALQGYVRAEGLRAVAAAVVGYLFLAGAPSAAGYGIAYSVVAAYRRARRRGGNAAPAA